MYKDAFKKIKQFLKEAKTNEQKKAIVKLCVMFLFFFVVIILLRISNSNNRYIDYSKINNNSYDFEFSLEKLLSNNYHYIYTINNDEKVIIYEGNKDYQNEIFNINSDSNYYKYDDKYLKDFNGVWSKIDNPRLYEEFFDIGVLSTILENSTLDSKTEYNDDKKVYNYLVTTTSLVKILDKQNIDIDDIPNKIVLNTDSLDNVVEITFDMSSYAKYKQLGNNLLINNKYSQFGEIKIEDPQ